MTCKHFQEIANILRQAKPHIEAMVYSTMVSQFRTLCRETNDRFDGDRFTRACYPEMPNDSD